MSLQKKHIMTLKDSIKYILESHSVSVKLVGVLNLQTRLSGRPANYTQSRRSSYEISVPESRQPRILITNQKLMYPLFQPTFAKIGKKLPIRTARFSVVILR